MVLDGLFSIQKHQDANSDEKKSWLLAEQAYQLLKKEVMMWLLRSKEA
jgi:hypothetical protein